MQVRVALIAIIFKKIWKNIILMKQLKNLRNVMNPAIIVKIRILVHNVKLVIILLKVRKSKNYVIMKK